MDTLYKTVPFEVTDFKAADSGGWQFSGYASTFGNVDQGGDVVMRGAFDTSLGTRKRRPLLWQHDLREPIGVEVALKPDDRGLLGTWKVVDTARGTDAHKLLKAGAIDSMSIGYLPKTFEFDDVGVCKLLEVDLLECSLVSLPMNEAALVTQVKNRRLEPLQDAFERLERLLQISEDEPFEDILTQVKGFLKRSTEVAEALQSRRAAAGRELSSGHRVAIEDLVTEAKAAADRLERLIPGEPELAEAAADDPAFRAELRHRLALHRQKMETRR